MIDLHKNFPNICIFNSDALETLSFYQKKNKYGPNNSSTTVHHDLRKTIFINIILKENLDVLALSLILGHIWLGVCESRSKGEMQIVIDNLMHLQLVLLKRLP